MMIWNQSQMAKREKTHLRVIWLDLTNFTNFSSLQMCFALQDFITVQS